MRRLLRTAAVLALLSASFAACRHRDGQTDVPLPTPENDSAVVLVVPNDSSLAHLRHFVSARFHDVGLLINGVTHDISVDTDLMSLQYLTAGVMVGTDEIPPDEVHHDIDKIYGEFLSRPDGKGADDLAGGLHEWNHIKIGGRLLFPLTFSIPGLLGPVGINLGAEATFKRAYTFTVKTKQLIEDHRHVLTETWSRVAQAYNSIGAIRIPFSADALVKKFVPGSEIQIEGIQGILTRVGANLGATPVVQANVDLFALLSGSFVSKLKVLADPEKQLVRYSVRKTKEAGAGTDESLTLGISLFQTSLVSGVLNVNVLAARAMRTTDHTVVYDYTYDIAYPEARKALEKAIKGDLRPSQEAAIFREDEERYQGVIINQQETINVLGAVSAHALGFSFDRTQLQTFIGDLALQEGLGGFLYHGVTVSTHDTVEEQTGFLHERSKVISLDYDRDHRDVILWGLAADNERKVHASAQIIDSEITEADGVRNIEVPKLSFSYSYQNRKKGQGPIVAFFRTANRILGPEMKETIQRMSATEDQCGLKKPAVFSLRGTLYDKAIARVAAYPEAALWQTLGQLLDVPETVDFRDPEIRETYLKALDRSEVTHEVRKFEQDFLPVWRKLGNRASDKFRMVMLRKIIRAYDEDTTGFEFLLALASRDGAEGQFGSVQLQSAKCNFTWSQKGDLDFNLGDVSLDWR